MGAYGMKEEMGALGAHELFKVSHMTYSLELSIDGGVRMVLFVGLRSVRFQI